MTLEKMGEFFDNRLNGYEEHQLTCIESAPLFYAETARLLPSAPGARILDLGCGTGLELNEYFRRNPGAAVTGIDLATGMLRALRAKFPGKQLTLHNASYFDIPFGEECFDAAVSVESLHHFTQEQKIPLYRKLCSALTPSGYFILTDYLVLDDATEAQNFAELARLKKEAGIPAEEFYHYDTPLTEAHETEALLAGGFARVERLNRWGNTTLLCAWKR